MTEPTTPTTTKPRRELARRTSNGIEVRLVWSATASRSKRGSMTVTGNIQKNILRAGEEIPGHEDQLA